MELLELHNITKHYPGITALDHVSISFRQGEVHAIVGENGAGKSTFIKTISGAVQPNEGEIVFDGVSYSHLTPQKSLELGISVVYQELIQFEAMSVADNLFMSDGSDGGFFVNEAERCKKGGGAAGKVPLPCVAQDVDQGAVHRKPADRGDLKGNTEKGESPDP